MQNTRKTILVTGGAGFIGSNFIEHYLKESLNIRIINLDKLTYAANLNNLSECKKNKNYIFVHGDICDSTLVNKLFREYGIDSVIHFAAETHVDNSIENPGNFIKTNIEGTFNLLQAADQYWSKGRLEGKNKQLQRFHHISTDEVYGSLGQEGFFHEKSSYAPNSPYSASKAASDFLVRSYHHTYGMNTVVSNCSNNYGPNQHIEKLIPTIIRKALAEEAIPIYGDGKNIRDWLYVEDHCKAIKLIFEEGNAGETYLVGGNCERTNLSIAKTICSILDKKLPRENGNKYVDLIAFVEDRPGHDFRYAIDTSKMYRTFGWNPEENLSSGLEKTIDYFMKQFTVKR